VTVLNLKIDGSVRLGIQDLFLHVDDLQLSVAMGELKVRSHFSGDHSLDSEWSK